MKPLKAPKKEKKDDVSRLLILICSQLYYYCLLLLIICLQDEDTKAFKERQKAEAAEMKAARERGTFVFVQRSEQF